MFVEGERTGQLEPTTDTYTHTLTNPFEFQLFGRMKESSSPAEEERCKIQLHEQFALVHSKSKNK